MLKIAWKFMTIQKKNCMNQSLWNYCLYVWFRSIFYFQNHEFPKCYFITFIYIYIIKVWMHIMHDIGSRRNKKYFLAHCHKLNQINSIKKPKDGGSDSLFCVWAHKCQRAHVWISRQWTREWIVWAFNQDTATLNVEKVWFHFISILVRGILFKTSKSQAKE
jgi:hypothetical protein